MNCPQCDLYCEDGSVQCGCGYRFPSAVESSGRGGRSVSARAQKSRNRLLSWLLPVTVVVLVASYFFKDRLPGKKQVLAEIHREPVQTADRLPAPFTVVRKGIAYTVAPQYRYELYGLVVSYHHSSGFMDYYHKVWKDYLNIKDVCVIWGGNIATEGYRRIKFWSRDYICYYRYSPSASPPLFDEFSFANNHLLTERRTVRRPIMKVRRGDQIHLKGYLVNYGHRDGSFRRGTSITRTDRGDGACETVYVTEFRILKSANPVWRILFKMSIWCLVFSLMYAMIRLHRSFTERDGPPA